MPKIGLPPLQLEFPEDQLRRTAGSTYFKPRVHLKAESTIKLLRWRIEKCVHQNELKHAAVVDYQTLARRVDEAFTAIKQGGCDDDCAGVAEDFEKRHLHFEEKRKLLVAHMLKIQLREAQVDEEKGRVEAALEKTRRLVKELEAKERLAVATAEQRELLAKE